MLRKPKQKATFTIHPILHTLYFIRVAILAETTKMLYTNAMTIELTHEQEQFIKQQLEAGRFASETEVFQEALSALQKQQRELAELDDIFAESHKKNAHLDAEATEALIAEEVRAHRQSQQP